MIYLSVLKNEDKTLKCANCYSRFAKYKIISVDINDRNDAHYSMSHICCTMHFKMLMKAPVNNRSGAYVSFNYMKMMYKKKQYKSTFENLIVEELITKDL